MRLICPNCGAQYEVEDSVIPDDGRDVQCSNCGHTWFQQPAHKDAALAEELSQTDAPEAGDADSDIDQDDGSEDAAAEAGARERRELDPQVADVLREEAAREAAARRGEGAALETQPDLGLDDPDDRAASRNAAARARVARLRGGDDPNPESASAALAAAAASRRDLLPDIEEINSSLRASDDRPEAASDAEPAKAAPAARRRRGGFRTGFSLMILLAALAVAVYVLAPRIVAAVPQAEPYLAGYVTFANEMRVEAAQTVAALVQQVRDLTGATGG